MDLLQLPVTRKGNKYLLVLVDILTSYAVAVPLQDKSSANVAAALKRNVLENRLLGPPVKLLSDNGLEFVNQTLERLLKKYGTQQVLTTPYNPKANGTTERLNRTILSLLRGLISPAIEWDAVIQSVLDIYNNCPHSSTGSSPFEAITGRPPRHPQLLPDVKRLLADTAEVRPSESTLPGTNSRLRQRYGNRATFSEAWADAEREWQHQLEHHFGSLQERQSTIKNHRHSLADAQAQPDVEPNDLVVIRDVHRPPGVEGKLRRPYRGPWVVTAVNPNRTLMLSDMDGNPLPRRIPMDQVRYWRKPSPAEPEPLPVKGGRM